LAKARAMFIGGTICILSGCVITPPKVSYQSEEYVTVRQTNLGNTPALTPQVIDTANSQCRKIGKIATYTGVVRDSGIGPEEFDFKCVDEKLENTEGKAIAVKRPEVKSRQE